MSDQRERDESADPIAANDPTENIEHAEPIEPMESTDPTLPIERMDPVDPIDKNDRLDHNDRRDVAVCVGMVGLARIELATSSLSGMRSNRLSYSPGQAKQRSSGALARFVAGRNDPESNNGLLDTLPRREGLQTSPPRARRRRCRGHARPAAG
jgi:hypothetical protein